MSTAAPAPPPIAPGGPPRGEIERMVSAPAIALLVTAIVGIVLNIIGLVMNLLGAGMAGMGGMGELEGMEGAEWMAPLMSGAFAIVSSVIGIAVAIFIIFAAMQMKKLTSYGMALAASIVAMIPCLSPCCIVGLPIGIWALVILLKPEVKAAFS